MLEDIKFIGKKMKAQDNRATQYPLFVIQVDVEVPVNEDNGYDGVRRAENDYHHCENCQAKIDNNEDLPDYCEDCEFEGAQFNFFTIERQFDMTAGCFFTAKACQEHIDANYYHYKNPKTFAISAWRNYEMQEVMKFISGQGTEGIEDIPTFYK